MNNDNSHVFDVAVIGAGAAGSMAAIHAAFKKKTVLIERNSALGRKIMLTGNGRCNVTNSAGIDEFIKAFGKNGKFLRTAFWNFSNTDLTGFLKAKGLEVKEEEKGKVFPVSNSAESVIKVLKEYLAENKVTLLFGARTTSINKKNGLFQLNIADKQSIKAKKVIIATGGASYKKTGSCGDGFYFAKQLGHSITPLKPALVPLKAKEAWVKGLQGICLNDVRVVFSDDKRVVSDKGDILFTHFGLSGPLILDLSLKVILLLDKHKQVPLFIDLLPDSDTRQIKIRLLKEFNISKKAQLQTVIKNILPKRMAPVFLDVAEIPPEKTASQLSRRERHKIITLLKAFPVTVNGHLPLEEAMITSGGVALKEINPRTMESKIVPGLYFAGEVIDICGVSGGFNLQQAFSTGRLAGENVGNSLGKVLK